MEILVFAILAGYLFFRLWSVLGTRTGSEKPRYGMFDSAPSSGEREDNVVILPKRKIENEDIKEEPSKELTAQINNLMAIDPTFNPEKFLYGAEKVFVRIIKSFAEGDAVMLKKFLSPQVFDQFASAIKERQDNNLHREVEIEDVEAEIVNIEVDNNSTAFIQTSFKSEQMIITLDKDGNSYDNPSRLKVPMLDVWTFSRAVGSNDPTWYLTATKNG